MSRGINGGRDVMTMYVCKYAIDRAVESRTDEQKKKKSERERAKGKQKRRRGQPIIKKESKLPKWQSEREKIRGV